MGARPFSEPNPLTFETGKSGDVAIGANQNPLPVGDALTGDVDDRCTGGLGEDWRGVAYLSEIDLAGSHSFEKWGTGGKFNPFNANAVPIEALLRHSLPARDNEHAVLLITDAQFLADLRGRAPRQQCRSKAGEDQPSNRFPAIHSGPPKGQFHTGHRPTSILFFYGFNRVLKTKQTLLRRILFHWVTRREKGRRTQGLCKPYHALPQPPSRRVRAPYQNLI